MTYRLCSLWLTVWVSFLGFMGLVSQRSIPPACCLPASPARAGAAVQQQLPSVWVRTDCSRRESGSNYKVNLICSLNTWRSNKLSLPPLLQEREENDRSEMLERKGTNCCFHHSSTLCCSAELLLADCTLLTQWRWPWELCRELQVLETEVSK